METANAFKKQLPAGEISATFLLLAVSIEA
jgi:hypothetical protein